MIDSEYCGDGSVELRQAVSILFEVASELMSLAQTEGIVQNREVHDALMKRGQAIAFRAKQIDGVVAKYLLSGRG